MMSDSRLVKVIHERPALDLEHVMADSSRRVIGWMFVAAPGAVVLVLMFGQYLSPLWMSVALVVGCTLLAGGVWGCIVSIAAFYEVRGETIYTERSFFPASVPGAPVRLVRQVDNTILIGRYTFASTELDRLAMTLDKYDWRFVRDVVRAAGVFKSVGRKDVWDEIRGEFERLGFIGPDNIVPVDRRHELCVASPTLLARL